MQSKSGGGAADMRARRAAVNPSKRSGWSETYSVPQINIRISAQESVFSESRACLLFTHHRDTEIFFQQFVALDCPAQKMDAAPFQIQEVYNNVAPVSAFHRAA